MSPRRTILVALLSVAMTPPPAAAGTRSAFVARHRCAILTRLSEIHRVGPRDTSRDRFIAVALADQPQSYVQCMFFESDTKMFCEASSGAHGPRSADGLPPKLADGTVAALDALGFVLEKPDENFHRELDLGNPPNLNGVAEFMLFALHDAYGARPRTRLKMTTPKAGKASRGCEPVAALESRDRRTIR